MKNFLLSLLIVSGLIVSCKDDDTSSNMNPNEITTQDRSFAKDASMINNSEIQLGKLALVKAENPEIREYAQMMVDDHITAQSDLRAIAFTTGILAPDSLDTAHVALQTMLYNLSGSQFDIAYVRATLEDHKNALSAFNLELNMGSYTPLRSYAGTTKPKIEKHLAIADSLLKNIF